MDGQGLKGLGIRASSCMWLTGDFQVLLDSFVFCTVEVSFKLMGGGLAQLGAVFVRVLLFRIDIKGLFAGTPC